MTKVEAKKVLKENNNRLVDDSLTSFVELQNVNKIYPNGFQAVYDFNLKVNKYDFVALVGPSGCGKSTTLRMIAGLEDISGGSLYINKTYSNFLQSKDRNIAMVFQSYALYPQMTVYDNIAFGLKIRKLPKEEIKERVFKAADILDLGELFDRKPKQLSGGQMQRVALGRAIVRDADIFLMDEPLSNLDAKLRVQMRSEIIRIHKEVGATTIYVTHDQTEAMTMANVIVVMNKGFIQQVGKAIDVYEKPDNLFVATFIGSPAMNILDAEYKDGQVVLDNGVIIKLADDFDEKYKLFVNNKIKEIQFDIDNADNISDETIAKMKAAQIYKKEEKRMETNKKKLLPSWIIKIKKSFKKKANVSAEKEKGKAALVEDLNKLKEHYLSVLEGAKVKIGIRPENVYLASTLCEGNYSPAFAAKSTLVELLGSENTIHFDLFGVDFQVKTQKMDIVSGGVEELVIDINKIHIFDAESGFAIR
jgi:multiple sugar transport system ATP-binding protein